MTAEQLYEQVKKIMNEDMFEALILYVIRDFWDITGCRLFEECLDPSFFEDCETTADLLDVSITNRCNRCCDFCYRHSTYVGEDITLEDYQIVIDNAKACGVQHIAIGGGEPTIHPHFCEILEMTRSNGMIPNYSMNGQNLTDRVLHYTKKNCGAIAISIYDEIDEYKETIKKDC